MKALFLNCTLKPSPEESNTAVLNQKCRDVLEDLGVETEEIRVVDHEIPARMEADAGAGDEWPEIFQKVLDAEILVVSTPIWLGEKSSLATKVMERLYASSGETNDKGQWIYYNKVGGTVITGNEDGGKASARSILYGLQHIGFTIPPNADVYWVGEGGPGPSYIEAGQSNEWTQRNTRIMAHNLYHFARMFAERPIPAEGNTMES
ncbi:flavodoxin family protein [Marinoscillum furvescens]|uniref:Multimeric flavodoxin WrbA n=1 Tax=Marinoscillum furvescens DSM 4134 TaxID=1122208 RepID=A0A3D9L2D6_MARFU|nr:NAD(P)H-dependent oxidoreductase [Marinoscillum furvescens]RED96672.1 multimeric flavodoxin WrbA [Marinoscillum furvescens DSM 4134]